MITLAGLAALSTAACSSATTPTSLGQQRPDTAQQQRDMHVGGRDVFRRDVRASGDTRTAQQMCEAHNGTYFAGGDYCEVAGIRKP
jgi:hypothetical protein